MFRPFLFNYAIIRSKVSKEELYKVYEYSYIFIYIVYLYDFYVSKI